MNICVILPAAGVGQRFAAGGSASASKIEFELDHKPVFVHAIEAFRAVGNVGQIILAVHPERIDDFRFRWEDKLAFLQVDLVAGGTVERWETVKLALDAVRDGATHIAVHDAARPVVSPKMIERVFTAAERLPAIIPGLPVSSTLKKVGDAASSAPSDPLDAILGDALSPTTQARPVHGTVSREGLVAIQTPQVFEAELLRRAYAQAQDTEGITDDAGLVEALGEAVHVVEGDPGNIKITHPGDAELALALIAHRKQAVAEKKVIDLFGDDDD
ncbi:IspD/TarI family cytidylyltransferase [Algisphaera agarilytica]|uniref:2-C-methyl-D-erythritol 4-phosphate cytidylyltransferase n=1 Tax=Algisphaera agarilytica TaxID=1385975 RepID=A0A7X0HAD2_9BACT|nr:IspD/TarI family cytidylyltransferase [Algisphaera agarilytica]MBB6431076.1 2-C-methyl-D-erythritol 4-phosphate cytidylyltransferase [Algisphaera agarilytica]